MAANTLSTLYLKGHSMLERCRDKRDALAEFWHFESGRQRGREKKIGQRGVGQAAAEMPTARACSALQTCSPLGGGVR